MKYTFLSKHNVNILYNIYCCALNLYNRLSLNQIQTLKPRSITLNNYLFFEELLFWIIAQKTTPKIENYAKKKLLAFARSL